jgi:hypothetical protein
MKDKGFLLLILAMFVVASCSPFQITTREPQPSPILVTEETVPTADVIPQPPSLSPTTPKAGDTPQMFPSTPRLQGLVEKAKEDLAKRLSIHLTEIVVVEAAEVTWPDSSLGCPQNGMAYAEVLTQGYLIRLEYAKKQYEYHAGKGTEATYCPNPTAPVPGTPGNT